MKNKETKNISLNKMYYRNEKNCKIHCCIQPEHTSWIIASHAMHFTFPSILTVINEPATNINHDLIGLFH